MPSAPTGASRPVISPPTNQLAAIEPSAMPTTKAPTSRLATSWSTPRTDAGDLREYRHHHQADGPEPGDAKHRQEDLPMPAPHRRARLRAVALQRPLNRNGLPQPGTGGAAGTNQRRQHARTGPPPRTRRPPALYRRNRQRCRRTACPGQDPDKGRGFDPSIRRPSTVPRADAAAGSRILPVRTPPTAPRRGRSPSRASGADSDQNRGAGQRRQPQLRNPRPPHHPCLVDRIRSACRQCRRSADRAVRTQPRQSVIASSRRQAEQIDTADRHHQECECALQRIVRERPEPLRGEQRQKPARTQQRSRIGHRLAQISFEHCSILCSVDADQPLTQEISACRETGVEPSSLAIRSRTCRWYCAVRSPVRL